MASAGPSLELTSGVDFGLMFASAMWGVTTLQAIQYYREFKSDATYIKVVVAMVWILATAHLFLQGACLHHQIMASAVGRPDIVVLPTCSVSSLFGYVVQTTVQSMYAYRIFRFCHRRYVPIFCWIGTTYSLAVQSAFTIMSIGKTNDELLVVWNKYNWMMSSGYVLNAVIDMLITFAFCCLLKKSGVKARTLRILENLCMFSIETGSVTSVTAISIVVLFNADKVHGIFMPFAVVIVPLYALTMMVLLNRRTSLRAVHANEKVEVHVDTTIRSHAHSKHKDGVLVMTADYSNDTEIGTAVSTKFESMAAPEEKDSQFDD
ncbi:hypothetical protein JOM56_008955 [Amanita muscaria]